MNFGGILKGVSNDGISRRNIFFGGICEGISKKLNSLIEIIWNYWGAKNGKLTLLIYISRKKKNYHTYIRYYYTGETTNTKWQSGFPLRVWKQKVIFLKFIFNVNNTVVTAFISEITTRDVCSITNNVSVKFISSKYTVNVRFHLSYD